MSSSVREHQIGGTLQFGWFGWLGREVRDDQRLVAAEGQSGHHVDQTPQRPAGPWVVTMRDPIGPGEMVHPVYLDVPMMASFDAALHPDVAMAKVRETEDVRDRSLEGTTELAGRFLAASAKAGFNAQAAAHASEVTKLSYVFQRTEASRFNRLRADLTPMWTLAGVRSQQPRDAHVGDLVEISGDISLNEFDRLIEAYDRVLPWAGIKAKAPSKTTAEAPRVLGSCHHALSRTSSRGSFRIAGTQPRS